MLRRQPPFWCIPPALASGSPRTPAPTAETFQCFSGPVFTLQQTGCSAVCSITADAAGPPVHAASHHFLSHSAGFRATRKCVFVWVCVCLCVYREEEEGWGGVSVFLCFGLIIRGEACSHHSDAKILPLNTARAHVNTMTSLWLLFKWIKAVVVLQLKSM